MRRIVLHGPVELCRQLDARIDRSDTASARCCRSAHEHLIANTADDLLGRISDEAEQDLGDRDQVLAGRKIIDDLLKCGWLDLLRVLRN